MQIKLYITFVCAVTSYFCEVCSGVYMKAEWQLETALKGRIFSDVMFSLEAKSTMLCIVTCMINPCCRFLTFNRDTNVCRGHKIQFDAYSAFVSDPSSIAVKATESITLEFPEKSLALESIARHCNNVSMHNGLLYTYEPSVDLCYAIKRTETVPWAKALQRCQEEYSTLVSLDTSQKLTVMQNAKADFCWLGMTYNGGNWQWLSGGTIPADSDSWYPGEPNSIFGPENCVGFYINYMLNNYPCDSFDLCFVCAKE